MDSRQRRHKTPEVETLERVRRIETRLVAACVALGIDTRSQKPMFDPGAISGIDNARITIPSMHSSLKEIVDAVPPGWRGRIELYIGDDRVTALDIGN